MHELSIIQSIISIAEEELQKRSIQGKVEAIELEIGELAGIEISSLEFLWQSAVEHTVLDNAACNIHRILGKATCTECGANFSLQNVYEPCPQCQSHWISVTAGEELRVRALTLEDTNALEPSFESNKSD